MREYPENISELIRMEFIAKNGKFLSKLNIMKARFVRSILDKKIPKHHQAFYKSLQSSPIQYQPMHKYVQYVLDEY